MKIRQKIRKIGSSVGILLPKFFVEYKGIEEGDFIEIDSRHIKKSIGKNKK